MIQHRRRSKAVQQVFVVGSATVDCFAVGEDGVT